MTSGVPERPGDEVAAPRPSLTGYKVPLVARPPLPTPSCRPPAPDRARHGRPARANLVAASRIAGRAFRGHPHHRAMNNGQPPGFGEARHSNGAAGTAAGGRGCSEAVRRNVAFPVRAIWSFRSSQVKPRRSRNGGYGAMFKPKVQNVCQIL